MPEELRYKGNKSLIPNRIHKPTELLTSDLSIFSVSDLHLNVKRVTAERLCGNFMKFLLQHEKRIAECDIFSIAGDFFHTVLFHPSSDTKFIQGVIIHILSLCSQHNIKLRVLNGTRSHDWGQCIDFVYAAEAFKGDVDLLYIDDIRLEMIKGKSFLYIPDQMHPDPHDTFLEAKRVLASHNLEKCDYGIIHGGFNYQLEYPEADTHDENLWYGIVSGLIISGHIHTSVPYLNIVPNSSFDRFVFGEKGDKGGWFFSQVGEVIYKERLVNENSIPFIIFDVPEDEDLSASLSRLKEVIDDLKDDSYLSIRPHISHPINQIIGDIKYRYPRQNIYKDSYGKVTLEPSAEIGYEPIEITEDNYIEIYSDFVKSHEMRLDLVDCLTNLNKKEV